MTSDQADGEVAVNRVSITDTTCSASPHFLRLGNVEVNEGRVRRFLDFRLKITKPENADGRLFLEYELSN